MRRRILLLLLPVSMLAGCQRSAEPPAPPEPPSSLPSDAAVQDAAPNEATAADPVPAQARLYRARGNEPGWLATVDGESFVLSARYGELQLSGAVPEAVVQPDGGRSYAASIDGHDVVLAIAPGPCRDSMSGMTYPDRATLELDGESLSGCAGEPRDLLVGPAWRIEAIGGEAVVPGSMVDISFDDNGRVGGAGSCNHYGSGYTLDGEGLRLGPITGTLMACEQALMDQEHRLHEALKTVSRFDFDDGGALLLLAGDDAIAIRAVR